MTPDFFAHPGSFHSVPRQFSLGTPAVFAQLYLIVFSIEEEHREHSGARSPSPL